MENQEQKQPHPLAQAQMDMIERLLKQRAEYSRVVNDTLMVVVSEKGSDLRYLVHFNAIATGIKRFRLPGLEMTYATPEKIPEKYQSVLDFMDDPDLFMIRGETSEAEQRHNNILSNFFIDNIDQFFTFLSKDPDNTPITMQWVNNAKKVFEETLFMHDFLNEYFARLPMDFIMFGENHVSFQQFTGHPAKVKEGIFVVPTFSAAEYIFMQLYCALTHKLMTNPDKLAEALGDYADLTIARLVYWWKWFTFVLQYMTDHPYPVESEIIDSAYIYPVINVEEHRVEEDYPAILDLTISQDIFDQIKDGDAHTHAELFDKISGEYKNIAWTMIDYRDKFRDHVLAEWFKEKKPEGATTELHRTLN